MQSNARFLIGVQMNDSDAEVLTFTFQRDQFKHDLYPVVVPRRLLTQLGKHGLTDYVTDYYLELQPAEATRVHRSAITGMVAYCLASSEDS